MRPGGTRVCRALRGGALFLGAAFEIVFRRVLAQQQPAYAIQRARNLIAINCGADFSRFCIVLG
jgi:hypothetical protein